MKIKTINAVLLVILINSTAVFSQLADKEIINWYNGKNPGLETDIAYQMLENKESKEVIVAVIDSGVDIEHEDLKGKIWKNEDEIPDNGIDDDNNGYIDDVYGWSFLGDSNDEQLEMTRIYAKLKPKYENISRDESEDKEQYDLYIEVKEKVNKNLDAAKTNLERIESFKNQLPMIKSKIEEALGNDYTEKDVKKWNPTGMLAQFKLLAIPLKNGSLENELEEGLKHYKNEKDFYYNIDFDGRKVVGDNPNDFNDVSYGNNKVEGPDALHGTHVAGIIAAVRNNGIGGSGVAENVKIMAIRAIPNGDERDKDVALAIRYAVDNGAKVINMSFGKSYSPHQKEVYEALRYADSKDVLLVHAAGNDNKDIDVEPNFPSSKYSFQKEDFNTYLTIGASTRYFSLDEKAFKKLSSKVFKLSKKMSKINGFSEKDMKKKKKIMSKMEQYNLELTKSLAADFSNYGDSTVDVFAPGFEIYNTIPDNKYKKLQGTSMAAPMVSGVAALLKSYFPNLSMKQVKDIILKSSKKYGETLQVKPGSDELEKFKNYSITGGIVHIPSAIKLALTY